MKKLIFLLFPILLSGQITSKNVGFMYGTIPSGSGSIKIKPRMVYQPTGNLYTLQNAANPVTEVDATNGTNNQNGEFTITSKSTPTASDGTYSLSFVRADGDSIEEDAFINIGSLIENNKEYRVEMDVYNASATNWTIGLDSNFGWAASDVQTISSGATWTSYSFTSVVPLTGSNSDIRIYSPGGTSTGDELLIDNIVITEIIDETPPDPPSGTQTIVLSELKAFPGAFGAGEGARIDPATATFYEVTNLNTSGSGSFADAVNADVNGEKIIIVKVEGKTSSRVNIRHEQGDEGNMAIWGQFAPGRGYTHLVERYSMFGLGGTGKSNIRFVTFQRDDYNCTVNVNCYDAFGTSLDDNELFYLDHCSFRYSFDQTYNVGTNRFSAGDTNSAPNAKATLAYNFASDAQRNHSTASISGGSSAPDGDQGGPTPHLGIQLTFARYRHHNISHRHPNMGGRLTKWEVYNGLTFNASARWMRINGDHIGDFFHNYWQEGNKTPSSSKPVNKLKYNTNEYTSSNFPSLWVSRNFHSSESTNPALNQRDVWVYFKTEGELAFGTSVVDNEPIHENFYVNNRQNNFTDPADGIWDYTDVPAKTELASGHNRGINADGTPRYERQSVDQLRINEYTGGTSPSAYYKDEANFPGEGEWVQPTFTGTSLYADTDGDYMPDWFEDQFAFLDKNVDDKLVTSNVTWDFSAIGATHNYIVTNNAGYTNLEMCAAFYAGDFETMLDGTNNLNITN